MRTIKFRAWQRDEEEMFQVGAMTFKNEKYGIVVDDEDWIFRGGSEDQVILMQFTGLLDKNGKEIYEGDLLQDLEGTIGVVQYKHCGFTAKDKAGWDNLDFTDESKVIGNIYQNPELIK